MSLAKRVSRVSRTGLVVVAMVVLVNLALAVALATVLEPRQQQLQDGSRAVSLAHRGMLDQETALRAYLVTGEPDFLEPYREGTAATREQLPRARDLLEQPQVREALESTQEAAMGRDGALAGRDDLEPTGRARDHQLHAAGQAALRRLPRAAGGAA